MYFLCSDKAIKDLMSYYRSTWPDQTVTPKLHMLEDHALEFLESWVNAFGLYGEQGIGKFACHDQQIECKLSIQCNQKEEEWKQCSESTTCVSIQRVNPFALLHQ